MAIISPTSEYVSIFLKDYLTNENRATSPFLATIPGLEPIRKSLIGGYSLKDISDSFTSEGQKGGNKSKTQKLPRQTALTATDRIPGTDRNYQDINISSRNIEINTKKETATKTSNFEKKFFNLPITDQGNLVKAFARALNETFHSSIHTLLSTATQATYAGSNIGSSTTVPSLDLYSKLYKMAAVANLDMNVKKYALLNHQQANHLATVHGFDASPSAYSKPYQDLGERGMQEYETGRILRPISDIHTMSSGLLIDASGTSTVNAFINGDYQIGFALGEVSGFDRFEDKETSEEKFYFEFEYGLFFIDERNVFKFELLKNPG